MACQREGNLMRRTPSHDTARLGAKTPASLLLDLLPDALDALDATDDLRPVDGGTGTGKAFQRAEARASGPRKVFVRCSDELGMFVAAGRENKAARRGATRANKGDERATKAKEGTEWRTAMCESSAPGTVLPAAPQSKMHKPRREERRTERKTRGGREGARRICTRPPNKLGKGRDNVGGSVRHAERPSGEDGSREPRRYSEHGYERPFVRRGGSSGTRVWRRCKG